MCTGGRSSQLEQVRTADLLRFLPPSGGTALDIGALDGRFSRPLAERFAHVIALDLERPAIDHPRVECVQGNATRLHFPDRSMDFVLCTEVLEHIPEPGMHAACREIERVARARILIGVPYRQDLRVGRTTCNACRGKNPPWGHVNTFNERRVRDLFPACTVTSISLVARGSERTNALAGLLMDLAGNPFGTYEQFQVCVHCGRRLTPPPPRGPARKVLTRLAVWARAPTRLVTRPGPMWMHVLLTRAG